MGLRWKSDVCREMVFWRLSIDPRDQLCLAINLLDEGTRALNGRAHRVIAAELDIDRFYAEYLAATQDLVVRVSVPGSLASPSAPYAEAVSSNRHGNTASPSVSCGRCQSAGPTATSPPDSVHSAAQRLPPPSEWRLPAAPGPGGPTGTSGGQRRRSVGNGSSSSISRQSRPRRRRLGRDCPGPPPGAHWGTVMQAKARSYRRSAWATLSRAGPAGWW